MFLQFWLLLTLVMLKWQMTICQVLEPFRRTTDCLHTSSTCQQTQSQSSGMLRTQVANGLSWTFTSRGNLTKHSQDLPGRLKFTAMELGLCRQMLLSNTLLPSSAMEGCGLPVQQSFEESTALATTYRWHAAERSRSSFACSPDGSKHHKLCATILWTLTHETPLVLVDITHQHVKDWLFSTSIHVSGTHWQDAQAAEQLTYTGSLTCAAQHTVLQQCSFQSPTSSVFVAGAKWQYAPMAEQLAQAGILTCVMQYTLYPEALAPQMVDELSQALTWTFRNISQHGGNPRQVTHVMRMLDPLPLWCMHVWRCATDPIW